MRKDKDFRLKLIFPCRFEYKSSVCYKFYSTCSVLPYVPYGMGVLTSFLKQNNVYVEQEDLSIKLNSYNVFLGQKPEHLDLDLTKYNATEVHRFLELGEMSERLASLTDKILQQVNVKHFDMIGFSIFSHLHFIVALLLSKRIKEIADSSIVFGGSQITFFGRLFPKAFNIIDYMVVGDGRIPLLKLIEHLNKKAPLSQVPNLIYKANGILNNNPVEEYALEDMPIPDFEGLALNESYKSRIRGYDHVVLPYQISRGCEGACNFCVNRCVYKKCEYKTYSKIIDELRQMKSAYGSSTFSFCDDAINNSEEYLEGLCNLFIKEKLNIRWRVYAKVDNLDKHILKKMREAGCEFLSFGIESGSDRVLKMMGKGVASEESARVLKDAFRSGIINHALFVAGYPRETNKDINETTKFIRENGKYVHYFTIHEFQVYYGSLIYQYPEKHGIERLDSVLLPFRCSFAFNELGQDWEQKQKQQKYSIEQLVKAVRRRERLNNINFIWSKVSSFLKKKVILQSYL